MNDEVTPEFLIERLMTHREEVSGQAIALSGGVDSSLLFSLYSSDINPYTVGTAKTPDLKYAQILCDSLNKKLNVIDLEDNKVDEFAGIVRKIDPEITNSDLSFETVLAVVLGNIKEKILVTGQGADEIFYGYSKFTDGRSFQNKESMEKLFDKTLKRERLIADYFGKSLLTPYLDPEILNKFAVLPREYHIDNSGNKRIIRKAAVICGLPDIISSRPKKAAQYGSGVLKSIRRFEEKDR